MKPVPHARDWFFATLPSMVDVSETTQQVRVSALRSHLPLLLFACGIVLVIVVLVIPGLRSVVFTIAESGPLGVFVTGILYTVGFTAPLATAMVVDAAHTTSPWLLGLLGGLGALLYDLLIFAFIRRTTSVSFFEKVRERFFGRPAITWTLAAIGAFVIASPLPDELGSGLLGLSRIPQKYFVPLSFFLNGLGILTIALLAR